MITPEFLNRLRAASSQPPEQPKRNISPEFFQQLRSGSMMQSDRWEVHCVACSFHNVITEHPSSGLHNSFCEKCNVSLTFSKYNARPVIVKEPTLQRLREARERDNFRAACAATASGNYNNGSDEIPFWTIRPDKLT
jgi:hypothetical protein